MSIVVRSLQYIREKRNYCHKKKHASENMAKSRRNRLKVSSECIFYNYPLEKSCLCGLKSAYLEVSFPLVEVFPLRDRVPPPFPLIIELRGTLPVREAEKRFILLSRCSGRDCAREKKRQIK